MVDDGGNAVPDPSEPAAVHPAENGTPTELTSPPVSAAAQAEPEPTEISAGLADVDAADPTEAIGPAGPSDPWEGTDDDIFQLTGDSTAAETTVLPPVPGRPDATAVMPAATDEPTWSARAAVPTGPRGATPPEDWDRYQQDPPGGRIWWLPIFLGILALLLIGVIAVALYLFNKDNNDDVNGTPTPGPTTPSASVTSASPSASSTSGSPSPSSIVLDNLIGMTEAQAVAYLDGLHIHHQSVPQESLTAAPGTVLFTDPKAGEIVTTDTVVTLTIAVAPPTSPPATDTGSPSPDATVTG